jgi:hypothetical protein
MRPVILLAGLILIWGSIGLRYAVSAENDPNASLTLRARAEAAALKAASKSAAVGFAPSLEMKENADFLLAPVCIAQRAMAREKSGAICFDAPIELNAPLCRTYVVLFARYWVWADSYRVAVVWAEPHEGSLNFPIYPPTLNIVSDPNCFRITHQVVHTYDGTFAKPLGERGPFRHRFNSYPFSEIRFGEQEALDLRTRIGATQMPPDANGQGVRAGARSQTVLLPERPITVAFQGEGPTITIGGQKRRYKELETLDRAGGRKVILDYQPIEIRGRGVSLPTRIEVYTGDGRQLLRSARLFNCTACALTGDEVRQSAERFSRFDPNEARCRDLLIEYWLKSRSEVAKEDIGTLKQLRRQFADQAGAAATVGENLKRVNMLLQADWMLDDPNALAGDFREYTRLLRSNGLGRMVLFGGENVIETTSRWGQPDTADKLMPIWLNAAVSENDMPSILDFASARLAKGGFWTAANLLEKALDNPAIPADQRSVGQALRALALSKLCEMVENPDYIKTESGIAQARWALWGRSEASLREELRASIGAAQKSFAATERPAREDQALKQKLDAIEQNLSGDRSIKP